MSFIQHSRASCDALEALVSRMKASLVEEFDLMSSQVDAAVRAWSEDSQSRQAQIEQSRRLRQRFEELMEALNAANRAIDKVRQAGEAAESRCVVLMTEK